jgi:hypothetical protein
MLGRHVYIANIGVGGQVAEDEFRHRMEKQSNRVFSPEGRQC